MRVLIVDSDPSHSQAVATALVAAGHEAVIAQTAEQGLELIASSGPFDVLIVDYSLRPMNGLDLLRALRKAGCDAPAILLTSSANQRAAAAAISGNIAHYIIREQDMSHIQILPDAVERARFVHDAQRRDYASPFTAHQLLLTDPLTGFYARRLLSDALQREFRNAQRYHYPLACAMLDVDHFKQINDTYGHLVGDEVLAAVASVIRRNFRQTDLVFRFGGEEFTVLMPSTSLHQARTACERFLQQLRSRPVSTTAGEIQVTCSAGLACLENGNYMRAEELLSAADCALYDAKRRGRDRLSIAYAAYSEPAQQVLPRAA